MTFTKFISEEYKLQTLISVAQKCLIANLKTASGLIVNGRTGEMIELNITTENAITLIRKAIYLKVDSYTKE